MNQALATVQYKPTDLTTDRLGEVLVKSGFFQDTRDVAQAIVKVLAGRELGFGPIASMQGVYIVKGRVTLSANLIGAAIQRSGKYGYDVVVLTNEECTLHFYNNKPDRLAKTDGFMSRFTIEDARAAGIASETYKKFPRNMLFARALTNGARWFCPEVFNGPIYTPDELGATLNDEGDVIDVSTGEVVEERPAPKTRREAIEERYTAMVAEARKAGIPDDIVPNLDPSWSDETLSVTGATLKDLLERRRQTETVA